MLFRVINSCDLLSLTIFILVVFQFIVRYFFLINDKEKISKSQLILANSSVYNEFIQLQIPFIKLVKKPISKREYVTKSLVYDEILFRQSSFPILWLDKHYDVRWNQAAEHFMFEYLTQKQFPNIHLVQDSSFDEQTILNICSKRSIVNIGKWIQRNGPDAFSSDFLPNKGQYQLTWKDHVFGSFLRYMFVLFFCSQNSPRIEYSTRILSEYWSSFLIDKYSLSDNQNPFDNLAGLYIRRGDKSNEDSFWHKHHRWRNISYYIKGIVDEEKQRNFIFKSIFVMTDDISVMNSLKDYTDSKSNGTDEPYAREHLRDRNILYNVLAPQTCFDPFRRIGFDQFLVNMRFLIDHSAFTVGHIDSNVFRFPGQ